jgi:prophage tail gpP-like protein
MKLEVDSKEYEQFTSATTTIRLDALSNTFTFEATSSEGEPLPFTGGEPCRVLVDGEAVLTGRIEVVTVDYSSSSHTISIQGRDKTADIVDSTLDAISDLRAPISLKQIIERVLQQLQLDIEVIENITIDQFNPAEDVASPEPGENAFEFIEKYARKRQVLLTSDGDGNIVITRSTAQTENVAIRNIIGDQTNNIISSSVSYDVTGRYTRYKMSSGLNPVSLNNAGSTTIESIVSQNGTSTDTEVQEFTNSRQFILVPDNPYSDSENDTRALWEARIRKSRGKVYSVNLDGYRDTNGNLWTINKLYTVNDEFAAIDSQMLSNTITFTFDLQSGRQTTIGFLASNAYTLELEEPPADDLGSAFFP